MSKKPTRRRRTSRGISVRSISVECVRSITLDQYHPIYYLLKKDHDSIEHIANNMSDIVAQFIELGWRKAIGSFALGLCCAVLIDRLMHTCAKPRAMQPTYHMSCYAFVDYYAYYYALQPAFKVYGRVSQTTPFKWLAIAGATGAGYAQRLAGRGVKRWARPFMSLTIAVLTFLDYANAVMKRRNTDDDDVADDHPGDTIIELTKMYTRINGRTVITHRSMSFQETLAMCGMGTSNVNRDRVYISKRPFTVFMQPKDVYTHVKVTDNLQEMYPTYDHLDAIHSDYRTILDFTMIVDTNTTTTSLVINATNLITILTTIGQPYHDMNMRASLLDIAAFLLISEDSRKEVDVPVLHVQIVSATCSWLSGFSVAKTTKLLAGPFPEQQYTLGEFVRNMLVDAT